jgi:hypothetical protein
MSKVTVAFGSFIVGVCSMWCFMNFGHHTSTLVHPSSVFAQAAVTFPSAVPTVPDISANAYSEDMTISGYSAQPLDGLKCKKCLIDVPVLTYAGGQFDCQECKFRHPVKLGLTGAAQNTLVALEAFGVIGTVKPAAPLPPNSPSVYSASATRQNTQLTFVSLQK